MKRIISKHGHAPGWQRHGADWLLVANGHPHSHITRDGKRWLCYTADDRGDDGLLGFMTSLAAAKAYLGRRAQFIPQPTPEYEEAPL
ncbi:MAG: hypothetical protein ACLPPF_21240 [Rhodomicrobium sp.]